MSNAYVKRLFSVLAVLLLLGLPFGPAQSASAAQPGNSSGYFSIYTQAKPKAQAAPVVTKHPGSVGRNRNATVTVKTKPNGSCTMSVLYKSGPSKAASVGTRKANASGVVSWTWKVGGNTTKGTWPVVINCAGATVRTSVTVP